MLLPCEVNRRDSALCRYACRIGVSRLMFAWRLALCGEKTRTKCNGRSATVLATTTAAKLLPKQPLAEGTLPCRLIRRYSSDLFSQHMYMVRESLEFGNSTMWIGTYATSNPLRRVFSSQPFPIALLLAGRKMSLGRSRRRRRVCAIYASARTRLSCNAQ